MSEFKVGDLVYFPKMTQKICVLSDGIPKYLTDRPLCIDGLTENGNKRATFYCDGKQSKKHNGQSIFHATQENHELLSKLYPNVEFEQPPKRKEPKEIIRAMLDYGYHGVPCKTECGRDKYICTGIVEGEFYPFQYDNDEDNAYGSGIPYHPKTGLKIVDFIDGKCVLENGEVVE